MYLPGPFLGCRRWEDPFHTRDGGPFGPRLSLTRGRESQGQCETP